MTIELLKPEVGLNASFTSFEFRNKRYHEANRGFWAGKNEPRFITDAKVIGNESCEEGEYTGVRVQGKVERRSPSQPRTQRGEQ